MLDGEKIRRLRLARGLTQKQIAQYIEKDVKTYSKIENYHIVPSQELYEKILEAIYTLPKK